MSYIIGACHDEAIIVDMYIHVSQSPPFLPLWWTATTIQPHFRIFLISDGCSKDDRAKLTMLVQYIKLDTSLSFIYCSRAQESIVWQKLYLPYLLPNDVKHVLYLDADIIIRHSGRGGFVLKGISKGIKIVS